MQERTTGDSRELVEAHLSEMRYL